MKNAQFSDNKLLYLRNGDWFDWYQNHRPWMTVNCCEFKFSRNFALVGMFGMQQRLNE